MGDSVVLFFVFLFFFGKNARLYFLIDCPNGVSHDEKFRSLNNSLGLLCKKINSE